MITNYFESASQISATSTNIEKVDRDKSFIADYNKTRNFTMASAVITPEMHQEIGEEIILKVE
jgi:hypothetical protein